MKSTIGTILGTVALGLIKKKIGSSSRIEKYDLKLIFINDASINVSYLHPSEFDLTVEDEEIKNVDHNSRLILFPVENSKIIKRAGLYLNWIGLDFDQDDDPEYGLVYDGSFRYVMEPYDQSMNNFTIPRKLISQELSDTHINEAFKKAQSDLIDIFGSVFDGSYNEFHQPAIWDDLSKLPKVIESIPIYWVIDKHGRKLSLNEFNKNNSDNKYKSKLRRR